MEIETQLKNPDSAKFAFGGADKSTTPQGDDNYLINSYADSQNSFGGTVRSNFICEVEYLPNSNSCNTNCKIIE